MVWSLLDCPAMRSTPAKKRVGGHPGTGVRPGEKLIDYTRLTIRLPEDLRQRLEDAARALRRQQWRIMHDALQAYLGGGPALSDEDRRALGALVKTPAPSKAEATDKPKRARKQTTKRERR